MLNGYVHMCSACGLCKSDMSSCWQFILNENESETSSRTQLSLSFIYPFTPNEYNDAGKLNCYFYVMLITLNLFTPQSQAVVRSLIARNLSEMSFRIMSVLVPHHLRSSH